MALKISTVMTYPLTGAVDFAITFEYLARKFVTVTLIGKDRKELVLNQDFRFTTKTQITLTRSWGAADGYNLIEIRRYTSATDRLVDFADGSILRAYDLNVAQIQTLHVAEEARDLTADTIGVNNDGHLDARGRRIVNLAVAVDGGDAVPFGQLKAMNQNSWQARDEALQFRNEAETFRDQAEGFKNESGTNATNTFKWRNEAEGFRDEAEQFKNTSGQYADAAGSSAGNAKNSEDEARRIAASIKAAGLTGYITRRSFEKGFNVTTWNEVLLWEEDGAYYRWDGTLPKNVPAGSTPETSGGFGLGAWVNVGDAAVRSWANSTLKPLQLAKSEGSFLSGGSATEGVSALKNTTNGYYYTPKDGTITVGAGSSPDDSWQCVGLLNGFDIDDLRNWGAVKSGDDIMPLIRTAYELTPNKVTIPPGEHRIILTDTLDHVRSETYPMGLRMTRQNIDIEFSAGASLKMDAVESGRYVIIDAYYAHNSQIINPVIIGDVEDHAGSTGEWGYGIRNFNSSNLVIKSPNISYCWGDSILWFVDDDQQYGGAITGTGVYTRSRRQGISVISCRGLYIEDSVGVSIQGASAGPWATIDVEPDVSSEFIIDLVIGHVRGVNNAGPALLFAVHQLTGASQPVNITVGSVSSIGCQRCIEIRGDGGVSGTITVDSAFGRNSKAQELQTVKWRDDCKFHIRNMTSLNCNRVGDTSSQYGVAIGIYNNYAGGTAGGITIDNLNIINRSTTLTHPIAITNTIAGDVGNYTFNNITYDRSKFTYPEIHNPAAAGIRTNSKIYQEFTASGTVTNSRWCNEVRNTNATSAIAVTIQSGYGTDEMQFTCYNTSGNQMNFIFADMLEARTTEVRSTAAGKMICKKLLNTWSIDTVRGESFSANGTGRFSYGLNEGGTTANRPSQPYAWQKYFDTTLGYEVIYRGDTFTWVKASGS